MSGFKKGVAVKNRIEESFAIEVVRMAAKMEFQLENSSDEAITVNSISIDPATTSAISLFPKGESGISYSHLGNSAYTPLPGATSAKQVFTLSSADKIAAGDKASKSIYLQESLSQRENNGAFTIGVNGTHENGIKDFQQYNITRDILSYINRNDWIVIPMNLSRYDIDVDAVFYPPIGGYPAALSSTDPDGSQIFTFSSEGDFAIVAHVTDKKEGRHLAPVYYQIALSDLSDPNSIFSISPSVVSGNSASMPQEITGTLASSKGKASMKLTVRIYDKPYYETGAKITNTYDRTIYIIRN